MLCANFTTVPRLCPKHELQIRDLIEALQDINRSVENCEQSSWTLSRILCICTTPVSLQEPFHFIESNCLVLRRSLLILGGSHLVCGKAALQMQVRQSFWGQHHF